MKPRISLRGALADPSLLGGALGGPTWARWRTLLMAIRGEPLLPEEEAIFVQLTGGREPPTEPAKEALVVAGRRGGKTRAMSALAVYLAGLCHHGDSLSVGERGVVLLIAPDTRQAKVALDYAAGILESTPLLRQLIAHRSDDTLALKNGIDITVRSANFRRLRGMTCVAVLADEAAFWHSDDSANPDTEILAAARPTLATTHGPLIVISSPYAKRGEVYDIFRRHYGPAGDKAILVAQGTSRDFNPGLDLHIVERALRDDPARARAEYLGEFRDDIEGFVSREAVDACVHAGCFERARLPNFRYVGFVDPSGGRADSMTMAIAHAESDVLVLDVLREKAPPLSPEAVVAEFAEELARYGVRKVEGDRYGAEWTAEAFRRHGVEYAPASRSKSDLYRDLLPAINSGACLLLDSDRLVLQLTGLERRTARGGRDTIDHSPGAHDDLANAAAGALLLADASARRGGWQMGAYGYGGPIHWYGDGTQRRAWQRGPGVSAIDGTTPTKH